MILLTILSLCIKFALAILMMIVGMREVSLTHKPFRAMIGIFLVVAGVLGYVSSFF